VGYAGVARIRMHPTHTQYFCVVYHVRSHVSIRTRVAGGQENLNLRVPADGTTEGPVAPGRTGAGVGPRGAGRGGRTPQPGEAG